MLDIKILYLCLKFATIVLSIVIVMFLTNRLVKKLNYEESTNVINRKYKVSPWVFIKETIDMGYITCMVFLGYGFNSEKELSIMSAFLIIIPLCTFVPYFFVRREAFILISETSFEIKVQTLLCARIDKKIPLAQVEGINVTKKNLTFYMKDQSAIDVPKIALIVFRGYNNVIEQLKLSVALHKNSSPKN